MIKLGESATADHQATFEFPAQLKKIIQEKNYLPDQIFNLDETGLFWTKLPTRTWLTQEEKKRQVLK